MLTTAGPPALRCYCSFGAADAALRDDLLTALASWKRARNVQIWHRDLLPPGAPLGTVQEEIGRADVVLLLLSASHAAEEVATLEMDVALSRHMRGETWAVPILVRPFLWASTPIRELRVLPSDGRAVTLWPDRDSAWLDVARGIDGVVDMLSTRTARPERTGAVKAEALAERLAAPGASEGAGSGPGPGPAGADPSSFEWEAWVFDRCAAGDHASLTALASSVRDAELADRLREMAAHVQAGSWPPGVAPTLLRVERTGEGWHADVRIGFLGQVCSVALRPGARVPLGAGASLESDENAGDVVLRLSARAGSALRGTRARVRAGVRTFTRWLVPSGTGALGPAGAPETILLEMTLSAACENEEER